MRISYEYRKIFDSFSNECEQYKEMLEILKKIYICYSDLCGNPFCHYTEKLGSDFQAIGVLIQYFFVREAVPLIRIQTETISKLILQCKTKRNLGSLRIEKIKRHFKIKKEDSLFKYILALSKKRFLQDHPISKLFLLLETFNFNTLSHANLRNDILGLQNDEAFIEDYLMYYDPNNKLFPYGKMIISIFLVQIGIMILIIANRKNPERKHCRDIEKIIELVKNFEKRDKQLQNAIKSNN